MYEIFFKEKAGKELARLPKRILSKVVLRIDTLRLTLVQREVRN